jgi:hypothetical protein
VNLPNGGHAKTGRFPLGAVPWRYAAMPGSAIARHTMIAPERSARSPDDDMAQDNQAGEFFAGLLRIHRRQWTAQRASCSFVI